MNTKTLNKRFSRILSALLAFAMIFTSVAIPAFAADKTDVSRFPEFAENVINTASEFKISSADTLKALVAAVKADNGSGKYSMSGKTFYLANDIDLKGTSFTPIADVELPRDGFAGTFDGNYYTIEGINISSGISGVGLFGTVNGGTVKNLIAKGKISSSNGAYVGGIIGKTQGDVTVKNCSFSGRVEGEKDSNASNGVGGIVGKVNAGTVKVENCANYADVTGTGSSAGGILGYGGSNKIDISNCYNTGSIKGQHFPSGILANNTKNTSTIKNCYNIGEINNTNAGTFNAGIAANFSGSTENCYRTQPKTESFSKNEKGKSEYVTSGTAMTNLGSEFVEDTENINGGYPILKWQSGGSAPETPKNPSISIGGARTLKMTNSGAQPKTTLTVSYNDMDTKPKVDWSVESGKENLINITVPENANESDNAIIVEPKSAGKVKITAKVTYNDNEYTADADLLIYPFVTTIDIDGSINVGETVSAKVNVFDGGEYDYENYPELVYQWKYLTKEDYLSGNTGSSNYTTISGARDRSFTIPENMANDYLSVDVTIGVEVKSPNTVGNNKIGSSAKKITEQDAAALNELIDTSDIKAVKTIDLPEKGSNGSDIEWSSDNESVINPKTGEVTLPNSGIENVRLEAKVKYLNDSTIKWFDIKVYSQAQIDADKANKLLPVTKTLEALGDFYKMYPEYGTDTNVVEMFSDDFSEKAKEIGQNANDAKISIKSIDTISGGEKSQIADDGKITYFYADPNTAPTEHSGSHRVTFGIEYSGEKTEYTVPVIVYWDVEKVKKAMKDEIMSKVAFEKDENGNISTESDLSLPKTIDNKKWALISWASSDNKYLSVSNKNQQTPDTLFDPYVGVVKRGAKDTNITLTATCTFGFTNDVNGGEKPITLDYVYPITVKAIDKAEADKIQNELEKKLNSGFEKTGLTDAVTGKPLAEDENGKLIALNDIQFPTTRDFGIDGAETPVVITTDNGSAVITPDVNNAARVEIIRPAVGKESAAANVTLSITKKDTNIAAQRTFSLIIPALTQDEIDAEKALMTKVKAAYFDGIKGSNTEADDISSNLSSFTEVYEKDGELVWVRDNKNMTGSGIVPTELDGWYELQAWKLFRSSNPAVLAHENLLVSKQKNAKAVTVDSALSSETLGKYGKLYRENSEKYADYKDLEDLYYQPVSVDLTVRGTSTKKGVKPLAVSEKINVTFELKDNKKTLINTIKYENLDETSTAFDIFKKAMNDSGYTYELKYGTYVPSITMPDGTKLGELDRGQNSGWMFKVNGKIPDVSMGAYGLKDGDSVVVFYTDDYTKEDGMKDYGGGSSSNKNTGIKKDNTNTNTKNDKADENTDENQESQDYKNPFGDVKSDDWFSGAIEFVNKKNLMRGVSETEFEPNEKLSRAMIVTILYRVENEPTANQNPFSDISTDDWYANAVAWASENGIVNGVSDSEFAPNDNLTREQMAAIIYRYVKFKGIDVSVGEDTNILSYDDAQSISDYAVDAMTYAVASGLIKGDSESTLSPNGTATRAETATIIMRLFGIMA